jgi:hypothetical protein
MRPNGSPDHLHTMSDGSRNADAAAMVFATSDSGEPARPRPPPPLPARPLPVQLKAVGGGAPQLSRGDARLTLPADGGTTWGDVAAAVHARVVACGSLPPAAPLWLYLAPGAPGGPPFVPLSQQRALDLADAFGLASGSAAAAAAAAAAVSTAPTAGEGAASSPGSPLPPLPPLKELIVSYAVAPAYG